MTSTSLAKSTYSKTLKEISDLYISANKALINVYWQIGKRIVTIEQNGDVRAQYGANLLQKLSKDLTAQHGKGFSPSNIKYMRQFYLNNQKGQTSGELSWSKAVALLPVEDAKKRQQLEAKSVKNKLSARAIREEVKKAAVSENKDTPPTKEPIKKLTRPRQLELHTYTQENIPEMSVPKGKILIDCGFFVLRAVSDKTKTVEKSAYTYAGSLERVVDGDTLKVLIDVGFGNTVNVRLRLRGINTPEIDTPKGAAAKRFVQKQLTPGQRIVVKTHKTDIYGRFVADVFYLTDSNNAEDIIGEGIFLNNQLLEEGFAVNF